MEKFSMSNQRLAVKHWYDGFTFGSHTDIYNPWSITNFLDKKKFDTYWANTSSNSLVNQLIQKGNPEIKIIMEDLLEGKKLITEIDEQIIFSQLENEEKAIWSLFLASLEETVKEALRQIEEKNYDSILLAKGIPEEKIRHYGFAFEGKKVLIG